MKLHLGCGKRHIPGWVHVDLSDYPHVTHRHRIDVLPMIATGACSVVYCCHAFEYFDHHDAPQVLAEWVRVLRPGGILRLAVPDFAALCRLYRKEATAGLAHAIDRMRGPLYGRWEIAPGVFAWHRTVWDFASMAEAMTAAGLRHVRRYDADATEHAAVDDYSRSYWPHMDRTGILTSLNVEGEKP